LAAFKKTHHRGQEDFLELARRIGIESNRAQKLIAPFMLKQEKVEVLIKRSFLNEATKRAYLLDYNSRRNSLTQA
jgi:serine/threonine-protein kinase HipA